MKRAANTRRKNGVFNFVESLTARSVRLSLFVLSVMSVLFAVQAPALGGDFPSSAAAPTTTKSAVDNTPKTNGKAEDASASSSPGEAINVKTYGAVGDGTTDDSAAFSAALKALGDAGGGVCVVPKGTYNISATGITAPYKAAVSSGVHLVGENRDACVLRVSAMPRNHLL